MGNIIVTIIIFGIIGLAVFKLVSDKKHGNGSCGCCGTCPGNCLCGKPPQEQNGGERL